MLLMLGEEEESEMKPNSSQSDSTTSVSASDSQIPRSRRAKNIQRIRGNSTSITANGTEPKKKNRALPNSKEKGKLQMRFATRSAANTPLLTSTDIPQLSASPIIRESMTTKLGIMLLQDTDGGILQLGKKRQLFVEPQLAEPVPVYTGLPLEAGPTAKIKKDSLWSSRSRRSGKSSSSTSREGSAVPPEEPDVDTDVEKSYNSSLQTKLSEAITTASEVRKPLTLKIRSLRKPSSRTTTPKQLKRTGSDLASPLRSSKRIKVISPKKPASTNLAPTPIIHSHGEGNVDDDPTKDNDDFCSACGGPGVFICCETCPKSFHFTCCDPPLEEAPEDDWFCRECIAKKNPSLLQKWTDIGIFAQLMNQLESRNPKVFQLPKNLRDGTYIGVYTAPNGDYADDTMKPELSYTRANGAQIPGYNKNIDLEIDSLFDKDGNPYLCHKCGQSGLRNRIISHCDYCPLVWHIDCLDEPMFGPKTIGTKWRCPNHVEELIPRDLIRTRRLKDTVVIEPSIRNHFLRLASLSDIVIKFDDQPYIKQERTPSLQEYLQYQLENFSKKDRKYIDDRNGAMDIDDFDEVHSNYKLPDYFESTSTSFGVSAKASTGLKRVISITSEDDDSQVSSFVYRVPEKLILLDFCTKVKGDQTQPKISKKKILDNITDYDNLKRVETNIEDRIVVESLNDIKIHTNTRSQPKLNFDELVQAALADESSIESIKLETPSTANSDSDIDGDVGLDNSTLEELLKIKKLMELKGQDALMKFLQS